MNDGTVSTMAELKAAALEERRGLDWPTLWLSAVILIALATSWTLGFTGRIPLWAACLINTFWMYQGYTVAHECVHRNVHGRDERFAWVNEALGAIVMVFPMHSYAMHEHIHRLHHRHTNQPDRDPDAWVTSASNPLVLLFRCYGLYFHHNLMAIRTAGELPHPRRFLLRAFGEEAFAISIALALVFLGFGKEVLFLWAIPALSVFALVGFFLDWLPHHTAENHQDIRHTLLLGAPTGVPGFLLNWAYLFHNYHLVHHLFPRAPWHRLARLYARGKAPIKAAGARIVFE